MHMARGGDAQGGEGGCTCILCTPLGTPLHGAQIKFGDLTPFLTYAYSERPKTYVSNMGKICTRISPSKTFQNSMIMRPQPRINLNSSFDFSQPTYPNGEQR
jgi:hypothetical protein